MEGRGHERHRRRGATTLLTLLDFLAKLDKARIHWRLFRAREEAIMVEIAVPGQCWEVEFFVDGHLEVEVFRSDGNIEGEEAKERLFQEFSDRAGPGLLDGRWCFELRRRILHNPNAILPPGTQVVTRVAVPGAGDDAPRRARQLRAGARKRSVDRGRHVERQSLHLLRGARHQQ
jgi:hypothetical protein